MFLLIVARTIIPHRLLQSGNSSQQEPRPWWWPPFWGVVLISANIEDYATSMEFFPIEDAAQGYAGKGWPEKGRAHCVFFSFGLLKRASCLMGGLMLFESKELRDRCHGIQSDYIAAPVHRFYKKWSLAIAGKILTSGPLVYGFVDTILRRYNRRLSGVLLGLARAKSQTLHVATYKVRPNAATMAAMKITLGGRPGKTQDVTCCLQLAKAKRIKQFGLWPSVALMDRETCCQQQSHGKDVVKASVRLTSVDVGRSGVPVTKNAARLVEGAYFVHPSVFD